MNRGKRVVLRLYTTIRSQLRHAVSHAVEILSPSLFWRLKVWDMRHNPIEYELRLAPFLCDVRKIAVDIGADQGSYSVNICDHSANCIAFEPRPAQAARICEMAASTGMRIEVEAVALSDRQGLAQLRILTKDPGRSTIETANSLQDLDGSPQSILRIPKMRLDDYELQEVGFIKIDVEGHELAVLKGAQKTIRQWMPNLLVELEERHHPDTIEDVSSFLTGLGYTGFFILNREIVPLVKFDKSVYQDPANADTWKGGWKRHSGVYVNNFFFLPASSAVLSNAVLYVK